VDDGPAGRAGADAELVQQGGLADAAGAVQEHHTPR
jgi:hypothetical protein